MKKQKYSAPQQPLSISKKRILKWKFAVIDESKVPERFKRIDDDAIRIAILAGARNIEGLEIFQEYDEV